MFKLDYVIFVFGITSTCGAAAKISALAAEAYCSKFFTNEAAKVCAVWLNASLSFQAFFGSNISDGTFGHVLGKFNLKYEITDNRTFVVLKNIQISSNK